MDAEQAAQLVHELPPRPLRMNYPPIGGPGGMPYGNMGLGMGGYRGGSSNGMHSSGLGGGNVAEIALARQSKRLYCGNLPMGINEVWVQRLFLGVFDHHLGVHF